MTERALDPIDRRIVNTLQGGFPVCERPYAAAAHTLGIGEEELISRLERMIADGVMSRFGPLFNAERLGGAVTLCALSVPPQRYDAVAQQVNAHPEVAHNYAREHELNMWFVIAVEEPSAIPSVIQAIERETGLTVYDFPKEREYFIGLRLEA